MRRIGGHLVTDVRSSIKIEKKRPNERRKHSNDSSDDEETASVNEKREKRETREIPIKEEKTSGMNKSFKRELGQRNQGMEPEKKILKRIRRPVSNNRPGAGEGVGMEALKTSSSSLFDSSYRPCANPIDRLCQMLMGWNIFHPKQNPESIAKIPSKFTSVGEYVSVWEPLLIDEIKENILSNLNMCSPSKEHSKTTMNLTETNLNHKTVNIAKLNFSIQELDTFTNRDKIVKREFSVFDLLLISSNPIKFPLKSSSFAPGSYMLGIVTSTSRAEGGYAVSVDEDKWSSFKQAAGSRKGAIIGGAKYDGNVSGLHYIIIDSLISSWREYMSLHQLYTLPNSMITSVLGKPHPENVIRSENITNSEEDVHEGGGGTITPPAATPPGVYPPAADAVEASFVTSNTDSAEGSGIEGEGILAAFSPSVSRNNSQSQEGIEEGVDSLPPIKVEEGEGSCEDGASVKFAPCSPPDTPPPPPSPEDKKDGDGVKQEKINAEEVGIHHDLGSSWYINGLSDVLLGIYKHKYNPSQLRAIQSGVSNKGLTMIQGPPGTGKTTTIIGLLNALHTKQYQRYYEDLLKAALGEEGIACRCNEAEAKWTALVSLMSRSKPHILVAAPSNVAVDNIIQRVMESGFLDGNGCKYFPNILRIGGRRRTEVKAVSIEETLENVLTMKDEERDYSLALANKNMSSLVQEILHVQSMLLMMKSAFDACCPLPLGWELRVVDTPQIAPYWVDHKNRCTQPHPPEIHQIDHHDTNPPAMTVDSQPEYGLLAAKLTGLLEKLYLSHLQNIRYKSQMYAHQRQSAKQTIENSIIEEAHILFTTLNSSGHPSLETSKFSVTVIDEAAQSVEPSVLIPLRLGSERCVLVGDHNQLPATIFSKFAKRKGYDRSLFERCTHHKYGDDELESRRVVMLDTQYRMLPEISKFPSKTFYNDRLKNGENVNRAGYRPLYLGGTCATARNGVECMLSPFVFFDLKSSRDQYGGSSGSNPSLSRSNPEEARLCVSILKLLIAEASSRAEKVGSIGIITPYQDQLALLRKEFIASGLLSKRTETSTGDESTGGGRGGVYSASQELGGHYVSDMPDLELNTVDAFQGREKDVIIFSCVRAGDDGIGFLSDTRRMNVAITRGRFGCFVVGREETLKKNEFWNLFVTHARTTGCLASVQSSMDDLKVSLKEMKIKGTDVSVERHDDHNDVHSNKEGAEEEGGLDGRGRLIVDRYELDIASSSSSSSSSAGADYATGEAELEEGECDYEEAIDSNNEVYGLMSI